MRKEAFYISILILLFQSSYAQHCPWDGTSFIMIAAPKSPERIQSIYLVDSSGSIVTSRWYSGPDSVRIDTAKFWRNSDADPKDRSLQKRVYHFSFAGDHYVLSFGQANRNMKYQLWVTYSDGTLIKHLLSSKDIHVLCTSNRELWNGKIKPLELQL